MALQWFKFYGGEFLSDPKMGSLSAQERSCWITLLSLASISSVPGVIEYLTIEVLLEKSGISFDPYNTDEWDKCLGVISKLERLKMVSKTDEGQINILNWSKRQESAMTVTERVRKFRLNNSKSKVNVTNVTNGNESANDRIEESRVDKNRKDNTDKGRFTPPSLSEVEEYLTTMKYGLDAQDFLDKNQASGWVMNGGKKVKDWKAHARSWETRRKKWAGETFDINALAKLLEDFRTKSKVSWLKNPPQFKDYDIEKLLEAVRGVIVFGYEESDLIKKAIQDKELHKHLK